MKEKLLSATDSPLMSGSPASTSKVERPKVEEEEGGNKNGLVRGRRGRGSDGGEEEGEEGGMERRCGEGRVWIFLVLGVLTLVFSAVLTGIYMNVRSLTTSMQNVEVMPSFVPAAAGGLASLSILLLFWKRYKILVYPVLLLCAVAAVLCVIAGVLTGTHVLQPLLSVSECVYNRRDRLCQCVSQFRREKLELERVEKGDLVYLVMLGVSGCDVVEDILPSMLFTMIGIYGVVALVCVVAGVISLLVYRTERRRKYLQEMEYDVSPPSSSSSTTSSSDNYGENHTMLPAHPASSSNATTLVNIYTNTNATTNDEDNNTNDDGNTTPSDLIYSPSDIPMGYAEACRMRRCHSFSQPKRGSSPGSSASSQTASLIGGDRNVGGAEGGKLKEHRKKGRRAVTLHGLDREQLLLILSLQMRYLQESDQSAKREVSGAATNNLNLNNGNSNNNNNNNGGMTSDSSQDNVESSVLFSQLQRRAMTPTPRQERLSSSRTTDDDLDYKPAKLARSHTPQPYHFKAQNQYNSDAYTPTPFPPNYFHPYLIQQPPQQQQQQQPQQLQPLQTPQLAPPPPPPPPPPAADVEDDEPPTMITYDLRNITKTGPIVYENVPSARSSLSYYSMDGSTSSNTSSLLRGPAGPLSPKTPQGPLGHSLPQPLTTPATDPATQVRMLGGNVSVQGPVNPQGTSSPQTSEITATPGQDSAAPDSKKGATPKEKTPEPPPTKAKGKKKLSKKEKNAAKKEEESAAEAANAAKSGLARTDSNASKGGTVPDRWQTLMGDGSTQGQTLWENVQKKVMSDPATPDSTLDLYQHRHPLTSRQRELALGATNTSGAYQVNTNMASGITANAGGSAQYSGKQPVVLNGILKNSNATSYSPPTKLCAPTVSQNVQGTMNIAPHMQYPNPNPLPKNQLCAQHQNAFLPIANSSTDNYEDIDEVFPAGQQPNLASLPGANPNVEIPPPKPPRLHERQTGKLSNMPQQGNLNVENQAALRPRSYLNAVERQMMGKSDVDQSGHHMSPQLPPEMVGHQLMTHMQMEGPVRDMGLNSMETDGHFDVNGDLYAQPLRKSNPNSKLVQASADHNPAQIYQNAHQISASLGQPNLNKQRQTHPQHNSHLVQQQRSAFHTLGHAPKYSPSQFQDPSAGHEICDTDLDDLPMPRWPNRYLRSQSFSPPPYAPPPVYQSLESINRHPSIRSASSSSEDPQSTSYTSSERSCTPLGEVTRGYPYLRGQGQGSQVQARGRQPAHITDRRFCITHQRQQQQQMYEDNQRALQQQNVLGLDADQIYVNHAGGKGQVGAESQPYVIMRRCQSVEERNRNHLPVDIYPGHHLDPVGQQTIINGVYQNINALQKGKNIMGNGHAGVALVSPNNTTRANIQNDGQQFDGENYLRANAAAHGKGSHQNPGAVLDYSAPHIQNKPHGTEPAMLLTRQISGEEVAGYAGVVQLTESSDSDKDEFAETVI